MSSALKALRAVLPYLALLFIFAWIVNFFWFQAESRPLGGSALGGYIRDGHYYLSLAGTYTEVSQAVWERLRVHELIVILSTPVAVLCFVVFLFSAAFPAVAGMRGGQSVDERVRRVQASGALLGGGRCGGSLSGVKYGGPFLLVQVYAAGIIIHPLLAPQVVILTDEVRRIEWKSHGNRVEITHRSPDILSPIMLYVATWTDVGAAIKAFERQLQAGDGSDSSA